MTELRWIGNVLIVLGLWGIGNRQRNAFVASVAGESCWIVAAYQAADWALCAICIVFAAMAVRSFVKWGR